jgi:hypothetical protein
MTAFVYALDNSARVDEGDELVGFVTVEADTPEQGEAKLLAKNDLRDSEVVHVGQEED